MNIFIWILQWLLAVVFLYSGFNKTFLPEEKLIKKGQTGIEGLSPVFIRFIGISEIIGSFELILPALLDRYPI